MRGKKAVKIAVYISVSSLVFSGAIALPAYAVGETQESAETDLEEEKKVGEKVGETESTAEGEETQVKSPETDEDTEPESPTERDDNSDGISEEDDVETADEGKPSWQNEESATTRLEVPQKFDIVLDPWEMDGRGQIYSEEYTIKNTGEKKGTLKLTGIANGDDVDIRSDDNNINNGDGRNIFIEMVVNGESRIALLPEGADYETMLEAGESVTLTFTGKMNVNARDGWRNNNVKLMVIYDWTAGPEEDVAEKGIEDLGEDAQKEQKNFDADTLADSGKEDSAGLGADAPAEGIEVGNISEDDEPAGDNEEEEKDSGTDMPGNSGEGSVSGNSLPIDNSAKEKETDIEEKDGNSNE